MKKNVALLLLLFSLTACGADPEDAPVDTGATKNYDGDGFIISYPIDWLVSEPDDFSPSIPESTIVAIYNNIKGSEFTTNVTVQKNVLDKEIKQDEYERILRRSHEKNLLNFSMVEDRDHEIDIDGESINVRLLVFEGKEHAAASIKRFYQLAVIHSETAYIATGSALAGEDPDTLELMEETVLSLQLE